MFHAGRFFPEWDHVESKSPSSGFAALTHLPPGGKAVALRPKDVFPVECCIPERESEPLIRVRSAHSPSPKGEGSRYRGVAIEEIS